MPMHVRPQTIRGHAKRCHKPPKKLVRRWTEDFDLMAREVAVALSAGVAAAHQNAEREATS